MFEKIKRADPNSAKTWEPFFLSLSTEMRARLEQGELPDGVSEEVRIIALGSNPMARLGWLTKNKWPSMDELRTEAIKRHPELFSPESTS